MANCDYAESYGWFLSRGNADASHGVYSKPNDSWYSKLALSFGNRSKAPTLQEGLKFEVLGRKKSWKYSDIWIWPNWRSGMTRIEVLSSYNPIPGKHSKKTSVTKIEKKRTSNRPLFFQGILTHMCVCLSVIKVVIVNNNQSIRFLVMLHKIEWVCTVLRISNLE